MAQFPIELEDGTVVEMREFSDDDDRIVLIDDKHYRLRKANGGHYFMLKVGGMPRSIHGTVEQLRVFIARVHLLYRQYENRVRKSKEDAQRFRDKALNDLAEKVGK